MTRSDLLDVAIDIQDRIRAAKAKQAEAADNDGAHDYWCGVRAGLSLASLDIQQLLARHA